TGLTRSYDFPTTPGAFDNSHNGGINDGFVTKFSNDGSELVYSTFLGGTSWDWGTDIALGEAGQVFVTGLTRSATFPVVPEAYDNTHNGDYDSFVAVLDMDGNTLIYGTFLGGNDSDKGEAIVVDNLGVATVVGITHSGDFPTTPGAFDTTYNGGDGDGFVFRLAIPVPINANFSATPTSGNTPLLVEFTNLSTGDYDTCLWDFGDGSTSDECNDHSHTYDTPGNYTVSLTVTRPGGEDTFTAVDPITVYEPVTAGFSATPTSGVAPLFVTFTNLSTGDYDTCLRDFVDGSTSSSCSDLDHTYDTPDSYTASLTVTGLGGEET